MKKNSTGTLCIDARSNRLYAAPIEAVHSASLSAYASNAYIKMISAEELVHLSQQEVKVATSTQIPDPFLGAERSETPKTMTSASQPYASNQSTTSLDPASPKFASREPAARKPTYQGSSMQFADNATAVERERFHFSAPFYTLDTRSATYLQSSISAIGATHDKAYSKTSTHSGTQPKAHSNTRSSTHGITNDARKLPSLSSTQQPAGSSKVTPKPIRAKQEEGILNEDSSKCIIIPLQRDPSPQYNNNILPNEAKHPSFVDAYQSTQKFKQSTCLYIKKP